MAPPTPNLLFDSSKTRGSRLCLPSVRGAAMPVLLRQFATLALLVAFLLESWMYEPSIDFLKTSLQRRPELRKGWCPDSDHVREALRIGRQRLFLPAETEQRDIRAALLQRHGGQIAVDEKVARIKLECRAFLLHAPTVFQ